ncbi:glycine betaine ABC transporter substrate-binding protein [Mycobacterium sp.]|uniref:glycine betaine ABC transporter substrate-binding protein n=1 Tax=Mycobacterium sp. TaxID=1785 RepID=UPI003A8C0F22
MWIARAAGGLLALALVVAVGSGCSAHGGPGHGPGFAVGARPTAESKLLAAVYVAALRSYGFGARTETAPDPMVELDSGAVTVVPAFTGTVLHSLQPDSSARSDKQVYRTMNSALPEGIAAGDYATEADDKPALVVTPATARAWGGEELSLLLRHCDGMRAGRIAGSDGPASVGTCRLSVIGEFSDTATMFAALRDGQLTAAWATAADPGIPPDLVVLADSGKSPLIRAENVVPLYRRNALNTGQLLAVNEVAGILDTAALADMRGKVAAGADPQAVADAWLAEHPLGR